MTEKDPRGLLNLESLRIMMTTVTTNVGPNRRYTSIRITDDTSGQMIAEVSIQPDQLINLLGNSEAEASGRVGTHVHRWGKEHRHEERRITAEDGSRLGYGDQPDHPRVKAAIEQAHADGWESVTYRHSHGTHSIMCRRWE